MFEQQSENGIALLTLRHGRANAMDTGFCTGLTGRMEALQASTDRAVVITATGKIFSAGVDLPQLVGGGADYVAKFLPAFERMCRTVLCFPKPVVVAVNGHAIAGGCILACAADYRIMADTQGRIGVPELRVGVPFPPVPLEIVRSRVQPGQAAALLLVGETVPADAAVKLGLVDELVDPERLLSRAVEEARRRAQVPTELYALTKSMLLEPLLTRIEHLERRYRSRVDAVWSAPETLNGVADYIARTINKG